MNVQRPIFGNVLENSETSKRTWQLPKSQGPSHVTGTGLVSPAEPRAGRNCALPARLPAPGEATAKTPVQNPWPLFLLSVRKNKATRHAWGGIKILPQRNFKQSMEKIS